MRITIITDGNNLLGMGHVYQSITLANFLLEFGSHIIVNFLTKSEEHVITLINKNGYLVNKCIDDQEIFDYLKTSSPDRIIFDKLDVWPELARKIKFELKKKLIIFTNLTKANDYADMQVMAGMGSEFKNIYSKNEAGQLKFMGPKYWVLRSEFYKFSKPRPISVENILLTFGGSDQANLSTYVLAELLKMDECFNISIIIGSAFNNYDELEKLNSSNQSNSIVHIAKNVDNVAEVMYKNDLVFVSPGLTFFESLMVGTPVVCFHQNEFQRNAWDGLVSTYDANEVSIIPELIAEKHFIYPDDAYIKKMEIGTGISELCNEILN